MHVDLTRKADQTGPATALNIMDKEINNWMEKNNVPGLAACIVKRDKIVWSKGYGMANITRKIPFSPDQSLFQIASISKTITATAVMQLREKRLLNLADDVNTFLKFSVRNPKHPETPITFKHLLTHTSSIKDRDALYATYRIGDPKMSLQEVVTRYFGTRGPLGSRKNHSKHAPRHQGAVLECRLRPVGTPGGDR